MAKPELRDHRKFLKLKRLLGEPTPHVLGYLECLWHRGYQIGNPVIGDALDVEAAAEFGGAEGKFATACFDAGFLDKNGDGEFVIHDLFDHAPSYAKKRMVRKGHVPKRDEDDEEPSQTDADDGHADTKPPDSLPRGKQSPEPRTKNLEPRTESPRGKSADPPPEARKAFVPPTVDEVAAYCRERGEKASRVDPQRFVDFYASKGWKVGNQAMRDWKACVRTWEQNDDGRHQRPPPRGRAAQETDYAKRTLLGSFEEEPCPKPSESPRLT